MHITRLLVEELRPIDRLELDLCNATGQPKRRTILLGVNGAGKTTVLDAIVHAFSELAKKDLLGATKLSASGVRNVELPSRKKKLELLGTHGAKSRVPLVARPLLMYRRRD